MFIEIDTAKKNHHFLYSLTDASGKLHHVGVLPGAQLFGISDCPVEGRFYLTVIDSDIDKMKLINRGAAWCDERDEKELRDRIIAIFKSWAVNKKERAVFCNETGETFKSTTEAAKAHGLIYGALIKHLNGEKSYNTVKGRTYRRVIS